VISSLPPAGDAPTSAKAVVCNQNGAARGPAPNFEWLRRFEVIYNRYGGSVAREQKQGKKLHKKYGGKIWLLVCAPASPRPSRKRRTRASDGPSESGADPDAVLRDLPYQREYGVLDLLARDFDPATALPTGAAAAQAEQAHPWPLPVPLAQDCDPAAAANVSSAAAPLAAVQKSVPAHPRPLPVSTRAQPLDNLTKCRYLLPTSDPLCLDYSQSIVLRKMAGPTEGAGASSTLADKKRPVFE